MVNEYVGNALKIATAPRHVVVGGKRMDPTLMLSPALGQSMLFWLAQSLSQRLHSDNLLNVRVVADPARVSGTRLAKFDTKGTSQADGTPGLGLAASLLLLSEATHQLMLPARMVPNFDYQALVVGFRETVLRHYDAGAPLSANDHQLHELIYQEIQRPILSSPGYAPQRGVTP